MAWQISGGTVQPAVNSIKAHNFTHKSQAAEEIAAVTKPHYDGSEWSTAGIEQVLSSFYSAPATFADSINVVEKAIDLHDNQHVAKSNAGGTAGIFAHKAAGTAIGGTVGSAGAVLEQAMVDAWGPRCIELLTSLKNHMTNVGGTWHTAPDLFNSVGTLPSAITTKADLCAWTIVLRSVYEAHRGYGSGVEHSSADSTNTIAAAPPDNSDDFDGILAVLVEVADELEDHVEDAAYHNAAMSVTYTVAAYPAAVSTAFTRANAFKSGHNSHITDTALHESSDGTNGIAASNATTIATYIALAAEIYTDQTAHFRFAPVSAAQRGV